MTPETVQKNYGFGANNAEHFFIPPVSSNADYDSTNLLIHYVIKDNQFLRFQWNTACLEARKALDNFQRGIILSTDSSLNILAQRSSKIRVSFSFGLRDFKISGFILFLFS